LRETGDCANNANCVDAIKPGVLAFLHLSEDEFVKALGAGLLHALETEANVYGKGLVESMVCLEYVNPANDGTFVIC
jgi:hypothetical protein